MKNTSFLLYALILSFFAHHSQAQQFKWVKGGGSTESMTGLYKWEGQGSICTDANGNAYSITVMGNNGPLVADTFHRSEAYGWGQNVFISSFSCNGQMRWAKLVGSNSGVCVPYASITTDTLGHVYVAARITNNTSYIGYDTLITGSIYLNTCLIQYDTNGHLNWIRFLGNNVPGVFTTYYDGVSLVIDSSQSIHYICNVATGCQITPTILTQWGTYDVKYDILGNLLSAKRLQLDSSFVVSKSIIDGNSGKLYSFGYRSTIYPGSHNPFVAAFDTNRNLIWRDTLPGPYSSIANNFSDIMSFSGQLYMTGIAPGIAAYKGDTVTNTLTPGTPVSFILKTDTSGSPIWMRGYSGTTPINCFNGITALGPNKIAAIGQMAGKIRSGSDSILLFSSEGLNPFFTILDTAGNIFTIQQVHGSGFNDAFVDCFSDKIGNLYMQGYVESNVWAGTLAPYAAVGGNTDFFIMKYGANCGCTSSPVASFTASGSDPVNFAYTGIPGNSPLDSVRWYFGDGGTSTVLNPSHIYTAAGTYHACVRVYSPCGGDVECHDIVITCPYSPVASFISSGFYSKNFTYTGTSSGIDSMRWKFGDGGTSTVTNPSHTYLTPGTYTVCVSIYTWCAWDSACTTFTIPCVGTPIAHFTHSGSHADSNIHFTYTGSTTGLDSVRWTFGDDKDTIGTTVSHHYTSADTYTVCVVAYSQCGNDTLCDTIKILSPVSVQAFQTSSITILPNPVQNELTILQAANCNYTLYNLLGQKLMDGHINDNRQTINIDQIPPAIYLIRITTPTGEQRSLRLLKE